MKTLLTIILLSAAFSCRQNPADRSNENQPEQLEVKTDIANLPAVLVNVLNAHGGLELWKKQKQMTFSIPDGEKKETHIVDLVKRRDRIDHPDYSMGYNGEQVWLQETSGPYEGDAVFYHNLMFYFYAMPFVLADEGIQYSQADTLEVSGNSYPGLRISYNPGVGTSPEDEYYLHFDPDSRLMAWLGYTVTYHSGTASEDIHWIKYDQWSEVNGLLLPEAISWYNIQGGGIGEPKNTLIFQDRSLSTKTAEAEQFEKPVGARDVHPEKPSADQGD